MKIAQPSYKISFDQLSNLFIRKSKCILALRPRVGEGFVQIFNLAKGLQARVWDCSFNQGIEMYSDASRGVENRYFTVAFLLNTKGFGFANRDTSLKENTICDTIFISDKSNYKMYIAPRIKRHCLSITFSKKWLSNNILEDNDSFSNLKEKICITESISMLDSMDASEKKIVQELLDLSWKKSLGSFYIKSCVLKIVSDFFYKIKERETFSINNFVLDTLITKVEKYLTNDFTGTLPNLKDLADKFSLSESTLKRHFKKTYGVNMSSYFISKKMEYARDLILQSNTNIAEAASLLGYRNINHFITIFKKHYGSFPGNPT